MSAAQTTLGSPDMRRIAQRRQAVIGLYCLSAFWGLTQPLPTENSLLHILSTLTFATLATLWFSLDRRILSRPHIPILQLLFFVTWPVSSLLYLVLTRGIRGVALWGMHAIGMIAMMCLTFLPAMLLLHWLGLLDLDAVADR